MKYIPAFILFCATAMSALVAQEDNAPSSPESPDAARAAARSKSVLPAARRMEALKMADRILNVQPFGDITKTGTKIINPFIRSNVEESENRPVPVAAPVVLPDDVILQRLAELIKPAGTMLVGDRQVLLLDGRRYSSGDVVSVTLDGLIYQVFISDIERNAYTLRLNDHELRRDFK